MPNWAEVLSEIQEAVQAGNQNPLDTVRRKYISLIEQKTGRNVIAYYSGWLQGKNPVDTMVNDRDKNGLMVTIHKLDRKRGLDLILHTPGGDLVETCFLQVYPPQRENHLPKERSNFQVLGESRKSRISDFLRCLPLRVYLK